MSFWNIGGGFQTASAVDAVLDKPNHTLYDVLLAEDVLKEVLAPNERLIEYLSQPSILDQLVDLVVKPPRSTRLRTSSGTGDNSVNDDDDEDTLDTPEAKPAHEVQDSSETQESHQKADSNESKGSVHGHTAKNLKESVETSEGSKGREHSGTKSSLAKQNAPDSPDSRDSGEDSDEETDEDSAEDEEEQRVAMAKIATNILSADVWSLLDALLGHRSALDRLWSILKLGPGDPDVSEEATLQLANLTLIIENLLEKRTDQMLDYIRTIPHFVEYFVRYVDNPPLVDFLLKVISTDYPDNPSGICEFLYDQDLIPRMITQLGPQASHSAHVATGEFLKAFVTISGANKPEQCAIGPNELSRQFVSEPCLRQLIELMLHGGHGMGIAVSVIIEVIRKNNSDYDEVQVMSTTLESHPPSPRDPIYLGTLVKLFTEAIPRFQAILTREHEETMTMPFGTIHPLGNERFRICELYAELLHCSNMALLNDPHGEEVVRQRDQVRWERYHQGHSTGQSSSGALQDDAKDAKSGPSGGSSDRNSWKGPGSPERQWISEESSSSQDSDDPNDEDDDEDEPESALHEGDVSPSAFAPHADTDEAVEPPNPAARDLNDASTDPQDPTHLTSASGDSASDLVLDATTEGPDDDIGLMGPELTGEALEAHLAEEQRQLRENPVIGDQLKFALDDNGCISRVFEMLFEFPWNNFLHNVVFDIVQQIFNGPMDRGYNKFLAINLFATDRITQRIVEGQTSNDAQERESGLRLGYVGHLTLISEEVVKFATIFQPERVAASVAGALQEPAWVEYVDTTLMKLREQYNTILGDRKVDDDRDDTDDDVEVEVAVDEDDDEDDEDDDDEEGDGTLRDHVQLDSGSDTDSISDPSDSSDSPSDDDDASHDATDGPSDSTSDDRTPEESASRFSRYLGHQLSGHHDDDYDDEADAWVPVPTTEH